MMPMMRAIRETREDMENLREFYRAAGVIFLSNPSELQRFARTAPLADRTREFMLTKAATPAGSTGAIGFDLSTIVGPFMAAVAAVGVFDRVAASALRMPLFNGRVIFGYSITGDEVGEGSGKPVKPFSLAESEVTPRKATAQVVMTVELLRTLEDDGLRLLGRLLRTAVATASDTVLLGQLTGNSSEAAGDGSWLGLLADIAELLRAVDLGAGSKPLLVFHPDTMKIISALAFASGVTTLSWNGGTLCGVEALTSDAQASDRVSLIDGPGLAIRDTAIELRSTGEADIQLDTSPTQSASSPTATQLTSLFQTNSRALRAERGISVKAIRPNSFAHLTGLVVGSDGGSPIG
jgi:hypothetical protein